MPASSRSLKARVLHAGSWSFVGYGVSQAMRLGGNLVMTRLLMPEMFGVAAIASTVPVVLALLSDIGLGQNIVQSRRGDDPAFLDTAWVVQIVRGGLLWLVTLVLSAGLFLANRAGWLPVNSVYASPLLPLVIAVSSASALISGFASTRMATALRRLDQKRYVQIELASQLAGLIVMIGLGVATRSIWALVSAGIVASMTTTLLSHVWMGGHPNHFHWEREALRELFGFGKWIFISSAVYVLAANGDRLLLGGLVDAHVLGLYVIAAMMVAAIEGGLGRLLAAVTLPAFSEIARDNPARLREVYYRLRVPSDIVLLFIAGVLFASGQVIVDVLFDSRYRAAGPMLQVLSCSLVAARYGIAQQMYLALGMPRNQAAINAVRFLSLYTLVPAAYFIGGTSAAIWAVALHALPTVPITYWFNSKLGLNDFRRELIVVVAWPAGFLCGSVVHLIRG